MRCKLDVVLLVMKLSIHRVTAAFVMGVLFGLYNHNMRLTWSRRGKDAFISHEMQNFDRYFAHPHLAFTIASGVFAAAFLFAFYELITLALSRLLPPQLTVH